MMKGRWAVLGMAAALLLGAAVADEAEHDRVRDLVESGEILSLDEVVDSATMRFPGRLIEVELEQERGRLVYELDLLTDEGEYIEVLVDAETGEVLGREHE